MEECEGLQTYSRAKEQKMKLILGQLVMHLQKLSFESFEDFEEFLYSEGIASDTRECIKVYLLRESNSLTEVSPKEINKLLKECKKLGLSYSKTGMSFPLQDELLEFSLTEEEEEDAHQRQVSVLTPSAQSESKPAESLKDAEFDREDSQEPELPEEDIDEDIEVEDVVQVVDQK